MSESVEDNLLTEEYRSCRELISLNISIMEKLEIYAIGACAALFVFALQSSDRVVSTVSSWLPVVIATLGFVRFIGLDDTIDKINGHLMAVEARFPKQLGWTTYYREHNSSKVLKKTRYAIWMVLLAACMCGAIYLTDFYHPKP